MNAAVLEAGPSNQAVVLVHGMGGQMPMETLRGFVETLLGRDPDQGMRGFIVQLIRYGNARAARVFLCTGRSDLSLQ